MTTMHEPITYNWRKVTPGNLPPPGEVVMTKTEGGAFDEKELVFRDGQWWAEGCVLRYPAPTHWAYMSGI